MAMHTRGAHGHGPDERHPAGGSARQVDELAGPRGRSQYVADAVAKQVRRDLQRKVFDETAGAMIGKPDWMNGDEALAFAKELRASWRSAGVKYLLDTTLLIDHADGLPAAVAARRALFEEPNDL